MNDIKTVRIEIDSDNHKHGSVILPRGTVIEVDAATAKHLVDDLKLAKLANNKPASIPSK